MEDAGLEKHRIDEIVLIHRIASIHKVQQLQKGVTYMRQLHMVLPSVEESSFLARHHTLHHYTAFSTMPTYLTLTNMLL
ncbi:unnamed protein product [Musa acuminata var. zebrina]